MIPLTVDFRHKASASGSIPSTILRRETRAPNEAETLASRAVDRALRPRFGSASKLEAIAVSILVQSYDEEHDPIALATNAASAAVSLAEVPGWLGPLGCFRFDENGLNLLLAGNIERGCLSLELGSNGQLTDAEIVNAMSHALDASAKLALAQQELVSQVLSCVDKTKIPEKEDAMNDLVQTAMTAVEREHNEQLRALFAGELLSRTELQSKVSRGLVQTTVFEQAIQTAIKALDDYGNIEQVSDQVKKIAANHAVEKCAREAMVRAIHITGRRVDGRKLNELRPLSALADVFPEVSRTHGSGNFARGETRVLATATLDAPPRPRPIDLDTEAHAVRLQHERWRCTTPPRRPARGVLARHADDLEPTSQLTEAFKPRIDHLESNNSQSILESEKKVLLDGPRRFLLHYEFPASATGAATQASSERRAIGHGALAERAISAVFPSFEQWPYSVRVNAQVLASNGSSSMAAVCASSLALYDSGVPIREHVAGISVGAVQGQLLLDLNGTEDHFGDMDFKIAGTRRRVTAAQLDVKQSAGVPLSQLKKALSMATSARVEIIDTMLNVRVRKLTKFHIQDSEPNNSESPFILLSPEDEEKSDSHTKWMQLQIPRVTPKPYAPRVERLIFEVARLPDLIGPRGVTLREIERKYACSLDTTIDGEVLIFARNAANVKAARAHVSEIVADVQTGDRLSGVIVDVREYGSLVRLLRSREGLLHISEYKGAPETPETLSIGDSVEVIVIGIDPILGSLKLSRRSRATPTKQRPFVPSTRQQKLQGRSPPPPSPSPSKKIDNKKAAVAPVR
uniref:polyribonucleotide nucleotidyltransferase n=1 Tax=Aureoumbra lagunensis TaxID=44058 RepID=A0A7S3JQS0_9STRA